MILLHNIIEILYLPYDDLFLFAPPALYVETLLCDCVKKSSQIFLLPLSSFEMLFLNSEPEPHNLLFVVVIIHATSEVIRICNGSREPRGTAH